MPGLAGDPTVRGVLGPTAGAPAGATRRCHQRPPPDRTRRRASSMSESLSPGFAASKPRVMLVITGCLSSRCLYAVPGVPPGGRFSLKSGDPGSPHPARTTPRTA